MAQRYRLSLICLPECGYPNPPALTVMYLRRDSACP